MVWDHAQSFQANVFDTRLTRPDGPRLPLIQLSSKLPCLSRLGMVIFHVLAYSSHHGVPSCAAGLAEETCHD